jgi:hypothetical protein
LGLQNLIKDHFGLSRTRDDGLLTNAMVVEAIEESMLMVADDCNIMPHSYTFPLEADVWEYPIPADTLAIRTVWYIDTNGERYPVTYKEQENFMTFYDPTETDTYPYYFSYPVYQRPLIEFYCGAIAGSDYRGRSYVTTQGTVTVVDSGANFGVTFDDARIRPDCLVRNLTDDSIGYVSMLDISTNKATGTADAGTNATTLVDAAVNFIASGVAVGDIICTPNPGTVTGYAWVTAVAANQLTCEDIQGVAAFAPADTYKVGVATELVISEAANHRGMTGGADDTFTVSAVKATINGTVFTAATVTGSPTAGAEGGDTAIAAGGSHGLITGLSANSLTVDRWIGGQPADGEVVNVRTCDQYEVRDKFRTERVMWLRPTPAEDDTLGTESMEVNYVSEPILPEEDADPIEIPRKYARPLFDCGVWRAALKKGNVSETELTRKEATYRRSAGEFMADVWAPPRTGMIYPYLNRLRGGYARSRYTTRSGASYNPTSLGL